MANNDDQPRDPQGRYASTGTAGQPTALPADATSGPNLNESYDDGVKRMQTLNDQLSTTALNEYNQRKLAPGDPCYRIGDVPYVSAEAFEKLPEIDRNRYMAWGNASDEDEISENWNNPEVMDRLAQESAEDGDAEVFYTDAEVTYSDDMSYTPSFDSTKSEAAYTDGLNHALAHHPDIDIEEGEAGNGKIVNPNHPDRSATVYYGKDGYTVTFEGEGHPEPQTFKYDAGSNRPEFESSRTALTTGINWVDEGNR